MESNITDQQRRKRGREEKGSHDRPAEAQKEWSVEQVVDLAKGFSIDDLERLKERINELAKDAARATTPPGLADWGIKLNFTKHDEYEEFMYYMLTVKGKDYEVKASEITRLVAAGTVENRCGRFTVGELLSIEKNTYMGFKRDDHCGGFEELQEEFEMNEKQLAVLLHWLYNVIGKDVDVSLIETATWYEFLAFQSVEGESS